MLGWLNFIIKYWYAVILSLGGIAVVLGYVFEKLPKSILDWISLFEKIFKKNQKQKESLIKRPTEEEIEKFAIEPQIKKINDSILDHMPNLIELLIILAILAIIASLFIPLSLKPPP